MKQIRWETKSDGNGNVLIQDKNGAFINHLEELKSMAHIILSELAPKKKLVKTERE